MHGPILPGLWIPTRAGNQRTVYGYREIEFLAIDFKVLKDEMMKYLSCGYAVTRSRAKQALEKNLQRTQYNDAMCRVAVFMILTIGTVWPGPVLASSEDDSSQQPNAQERLNQVLDSEGGTTVYKDSQGNVESVIELPNGERRVIVQSPQSPSINIGPPLQLNNPRLQLPPLSPAPAEPPTPDFPQRAR